MLVLVWCQVLAQSWLKPCVNFLRTSLLFQGHESNRRVASFSHYMCRTNMADYIYSLQVLQLDLCALCWHPNMIGHVKSVGRCSHSVWNLSLSVSLCAPQIVTTVPPCCWRAFAASAWSWSTTPNRATGKGLTEAQAPAPHPVHTNTHSVEQHTYWVTHTPH